MLEEAQKHEVTVFTISRETIRLRHRNTILGLVCALGLGQIIWTARIRSTESYREILLGAMLLTLALLGAGHLIGYFRYLRGSKTHRVEIGDDCIVFFTDEKRSVLRLQEVLLVERQKRFGDVVSLMMKLRNQRVVRLEGYERQEHLMKLVTERLERLS